MRLLPYYEQQALYDSWASAGTFNGTTYKQFGPCPWDGTAPNYTPYNTQVNALNCPSDPAMLRGKAWNTHARTNYMFSVGDSVYAGGTVGNNSSTATRGVFANGACGISFADIMDGTANTVLLSERCWHADNATVGQGNAHSVSTVATNPNSCYDTLNPNDKSRFATNYTGWVGQWDHGSTSHIGFNTVLPPNAPACGSTTNDDSSDGTWPPSSFHPGGVNVAMTDGSVRFVNDTIDAGNSQAASPTGVTGQSPYGVWGAMGSRSGSEIIQQTP